MSAARPLIGLCGLAGSGKDYAGAELVTRGLSPAEFRGGLDDVLLAARKRAAEPR